MEVSHESVVGSRVMPDTAGDSGNVTVEVDYLHLDMGSGIDTSTLGRGQGGMMTIHAAEALTIGPQSRLVSGTHGNRNAGTISIRTSRLEIVSGAIESVTIGDGDAGNIEIVVGQLILTDGAFISSSSGTTLGVGNGNAGNITITATDSISISGQIMIDTNPIPSGLYSTTLGGGNAGNMSIATPHLEMHDGLIEARTVEDGNAGDITIDVNRLIVADGAQISTSSGGINLMTDERPVGSGNAGRITITATDSIAISGRRIFDDKVILSSISSTTIGSRDAGTISIHTPRLDIADGRIQTLTDGDGNGGVIDVQAGRTSLTSGAQITTESRGAGNAGNIELWTDTLVLTGNSAVTTAASQADGGDVQIIAQTMVRLQDSRITTSVESGEGTGGNITIDPEFLILQNSQISADAFGGPGGNIQITAEVLLADPPSSITASSARDVDGEIDIQATVTNLSGLISPLSPNFASAAALLRDRCAAQLREGTVSSFVARERTSVPATPNGILPSRLYRPKPNLAKSSETAWQPRIASAHMTSADTLTPCSSADSTR